MVNIVILVSYSICLLLLIHIWLTIFFSKNLTLKSDFFLCFGNFVFVMSAYLASLIGIQILLDLRQLPQYSTVVYLLVRYTLSSAIIDGLCFQLVMVVQRHRIVMVMKGIIHSKKKRNIVYCLCYAIGFILTSPILFAEVVFDKEEGRIQKLSDWVGNVCDYATSVVAAVCCAISLFLTIRIVHFLRKNRKPINAYVIYSILQSIGFIPIMIYSTSMVFVRSFQCGVCSTVADIFEALAGLCCLILAFSIFLCSKELRVEVQPCRRQKRVRKINGRVSTITNF